MTPFDRALSIVTEYEAAGETSAARMLLLTRIEDLCRVEEEILSRTPARLKIGDHVKVVGPMEADWRGWEGFVCGICMQTDGKIDITVSDVFPPKHLGHMTDGFGENDLCLAPISAAEPEG